MDMDLTLLEMGAYRVMINKAVEFLDGGGDVPVNMEFRRFGLISDPNPSGQDLTASTAAVCKQSNSQLQPM